MKYDEGMRIFGSCCIIAAYFVILYVDTLFGVGMNLVVDMISVPFFIRTKSWDVVVMIFFLSCISTSKLVAG